jgi:hypothetical protein
MRRSRRQLGTVRTDEASNQSQMRQLPARSVPRQPETVGMAQPRLTVMLLQILGRKHKLSIRTAFLHPLTVVPRIHHQRALRSHGFMLVQPVEHDPPADSPRRRFSRLMQHGIRPDRNHLTRRLKLRLVTAEQTCGTSAEHAAWQQQGDTDEQDQLSWSGDGSHGFSHG